MNEKQRTKDPIFLATTALEEFWDTSGRIIFLGRWCCRYSRRSFWESLSYSILPGYWRDADRLDQAFTYTQKIYEVFLDQLAYALNQIHNVEYSLHYWRILLGPWLTRYIATLYDKYISLQNAATLYPDFRTIGVDESDFLIPRDTLEFIQFLKDDIFNLQLYTIILELQDGRIIQKKSNQHTEKIANATTISRKIKQAAKSLSSRFILSRKGAKIFLKASYFSPFSELRLTLTTRSMIWGLNTIDSLQINDSIDFLLRKKIQKSLVAEDPFSALLIHALIFCIPQCFLEGYCNVCAYAAENYPSAPYVIFSANSWYMDEAFKHWAAFSAESGTLLAGTQHGGNYGSVALLQSDIHEPDIVQRYYTWGWTHHQTASFIPFYATKLTGRKMLLPDNRKKGILYVITLLQRYISEFSGMPLLADQFHEYLEWQLEFAQHLSPVRQSNLLVRFHAEDGGWDIRERWRDALPHINIDTWKVSFSKRLEQCRLYVCDHLSTTFIEALSANKPTILFWNPADYLLREEAKPYYDALRRVGILFDTAYDAADAVNAVYDDVETWWNDPVRQTVRKEFCEQFARTSPDALKMWIQEFKTMLADQQATSARVS